jgi:hypothetical protein
LGARASKRRRRVSRAGVAARLLLVPQASQSIRGGSTGSRPSPDTQLPPTVRVTRDLRATPLRRMLAMHRSALRYEGRHPRRGAESRSRGRSQSKRRAPAPEPAERDRRDDRGATPAVAEPRALESIAHKSARESRERSAGFVGRATQLGHGVVAPQAPGAPARAARVRTLPARAGTYHVTAARRRRTSRRTVLTVRPP